MCVCLSWLCTPGYLHCLPESTKTLTMVVLSTWSLKKCISIHICHVLIIHKAFSLIVGAKPGAHPLETYILEGWTNQKRVIYSCLTWLEILQSFIIRLWAKSALCLAWEFHQSPAPPPPLAACASSFSWVQFSSPPERSLFSYVVCILFWHVLCSCISHLPGLGAKSSTFVPHQLTVI